MLVFTRDNWDVPAEVTVTGVDDSELDGSVSYTIVVGPATSADPAYNAADPGDLAMTNLDDDVLPGPVPGSGTQPPVSSAPLPPPSSSAGPLSPPSAPAGDQVTRADSTRSTPAAAVRRPGVFPDPSLASNNGVAGSRPLSPSPGLPFESPGELESREAVIVDEPTPNDAGAVGRARTDTGAIEPLPVVRGFTHRVTAADTPLVFSRARRNAITLSDADGSRRPIVAACR